MSQLIQNSANARGDTARMMKVIKTEVPSAGVVKGMASPKETGTEVGTGIEKGVIDIVNEMNGMKEKMGTVEGVPRGIGGMTKPRKNGKSEGDDGGRGKERKGGIGVRGGVRTILP
jgi:hypothetical protein